eukprot:TRINITY_DN73099_c0_g1_i1.p1 TRINITY_DN73099_c0_g1~~TRINITY_DN73099_c0_g1_i1.p1  ORF type:complete len:253 (+),score=46.46 TRINITY_DN73099_c0_g1_i1:97-759(+)
MRAIRSLNPMHLVPRNFLRWGRGEGAEEAFAPAVAEAPGAGAGNQRKRADRVQPDEDEEGHGDRSTTLQSSSHRSTTLQSNGQQSQVSFASGLMQDAHVGDDESGEEDAPLVNRRTETFRELPTSFLSMNAVASRTLSHTLLELPDPELFCSEYSETCEDDPYPEDDGEEEEQEDERQAALNVHPQERVRTMRIHFDFPDPREYLGEAEHAALLREFARD